jgi:outer membrane protein assembly factor BamB
LFDCGFAALEERVMLPLLLLGATLAMDWPQFRGPNADGVSPETGLARTWPADGPPVLWTRDLARGYAGAAVHDREVFVLDSPTGTNDVLRCLDLTTGKEKWTYSYRTPQPLDFPGARTVPTVDDRQVYLMSAHGLLQCVDRQTHQPVWNHDIVKEFARRYVNGAPPPRVPKWGVTQHPLLYRDLVIAAPHATDVGVVAYAKDTGKLRWQSGPVGGNWFSHVTPHLARLDGVDQVITIANAHHGRAPWGLIAAVDAQTGTNLWHYTTMRPYNVPIPSTVPIGDNRLFLTGGYRVGSLAIQAARSNGVWRVDDVFANPTNCTAHVQTPILYRQHLYANSFDQYHNKENNGLVCLDLAGNLKWKSGPAATFDSGNLLIADGLIFILNGATGELFLIEATPAAYRPLGKAKLLEAKGGQAWAPIALADGKLLVRDLYQLKCLDVRARD